MYRAICYLIISLILLQNLNAQQYGTLKDSRDGKIYKTVKIGEQEWMAENLNVSNFRNGDLIYHAKTNEQWMQAGQNKQPAWCYYANDSSNATTYGKLYNWYAVNDPRGLAPIGWHIPTDEEWTVLSKTLGKKSAIGGKMKTTGTTFWKRPNKSATNESGFGGLPGSYICDHGIFGIKSTFGYWWSSSESNEIKAWVLGLTTYRGYLGRYSYSKSGGMSVRCIKD